MNYSFLSYDVLENEQYEELTELPILELRTQINRFSQANIWIDVDLSEGCQQSEGTGKNIIRQLLIEVALEVGNWFKTDPCVSSLSLRLLIIQISRHCDWRSASRDRKWVIANSDELVTIQEFDYSLDIVAK